MSELVGGYPLEKCFFHVKAYREGKMLFTFHDAFDGSSLLIVERIEEGRVHEFSNVLGAKYSREENVTTAMRNYCGGFYGRWRIRVK